MTSEQVRQELMTSTLRERMKRDLVEALAELPVLEASGARRVTRGIEEKLRRTLARIDELAGAGPSVQDETAKPVPASPLEVA